MSSNNVILSLRNITKEYPGVVALNDFSLDFYEGEVHALLGENGAGKSTLIKIISGAITPEAGEIVLGDKVFTKMTPYLSRENGIEVIYQEFNLVDSLSAAENIYLGKRNGRFVNYSLMEEEAKELFKQFNIDLDPSQEVESMTTAKRQIVEITKAVSKNARILIMDEPSAPLTVAEVECMFNIVRKLKAKGVTIIYISHRMDEIFKISDRVTVMRDGCYITTKDTKKTNRNELISLMVGRELKQTYPKKSIIPKDIALEVRNLIGNGNEDISFSVKKGEILGVSGLIGAGRTEMARVIFGVEKLESGEILIEGKPVIIKSPSDAINHGIGLIPEDRKTQGCFLEMNIKWNISFTNIKNISKNLIVDRKLEDEDAEKYKNLLNIKTPSVLQMVKNLSGGNQQKVVLAKTLAANSKIIIFDEPTRGIDVGAKQEIYNLMCDLANEGKAIIMISSDMEELLGMSDRIIVLSEGRLTGELQKSEFSQDRILDLASAN
ncbi:sugar ABC transporter ATP-binding protein [Clostridium sp. SYSU_GA19001]|uniref:sugar ABC transporter ATP-binding protein n=1 Tax=Clostridium caldaquaticum TaxID=2940653 RepID=UPI0020779A87|nr:sugar ABC transporter ATP-binding protein [Clostridium caldaquaticum]MCM8710312.1 sugar ABC transporter ATP-binding protein [Clostridium caldaquaticum]